MSEQALIDQFREVGVLRLKGAVPSDSTTAIRDMVWRHIERRGSVRRTDPSSWSAAAQGSLGMNALQGRPELAPVVDNPSVRDAFDVLFGRDAWRLPAKPTAKVLLTFPGKAPWVMPRGWHIDFGLEQPTWPVFAIKVFCFFDTVEPRGGGTLVLEGSHRLVERFREKGLEDLASPGAHHELMHSHRWLERLNQGGSAKAPRTDLLDEWHDLAGIPVRVAELTGEPGDVVVAHMHVMHSPSPNTGSRPRQMLGLEIPRATPDGYIAPGG